MSQAKADRRDDLVRRLRLMLLAGEREQDVARLENKLWNVYFDEKDAFAKLLFEKGK